MRLRENTFAKIIILIVLLVIPIIVLYTLSMQTSIQVVKEEVQALQQKDIKFLAEEINRSVTTLTSLGFLLSEDIHIQRLQTLHLSESVYERNDERLRIMERLRLLNVSQRWDTQYSITAPANKEFVSTNTYLTYDLESIKNNLSTSWTYREMITQNIAQQRFVRHIVKPKTKFYDLERAGIIVEISFPEEHIIKELDQFKEAGRGDPFLYNLKEGIIMNKTANKNIINEIQSLVLSGDIQAHDINETVHIAGKKFLVTFAHIPTLDWYLIDYMPLESMLQPIVKTQILFYGSVMLVLVLGLLAAYLLYRNVQRPISLLIRNVKRLQDGNYSTRITVNPKNEFSYLFTKFNDMAEETERLIQKVYVEELRRREADVKQLQSQINPHFLYNCFALIRSMARLDKKESVMMIAMHLAKYYRYTTRVEKLSATLGEELQLLESYLEIQRFHVQHMNYLINVPSEMLTLDLPRLLLQPIVENAVIHGIEQFDGDGLITITGTSKDGVHTLTIEDNGVGMTKEELHKLELTLSSPPTDGTGCALWNINQRMQLQYGANSSLSFTLREVGGLAVQLTWETATSSN